MLRNVHNASNRSHTRCLSKGKCDMRRTMPWGAVVGTSILFSLAFSNSALAIAHGTVTVTGGGKNYSFSTPGTLQVSVPEGRTTYPSRVDIDGGTLQRRTPDLILVLKASLDETSRPMVLRR